VTIKRLIRKLAIGVKTIFWALPPAGGFINPFNVLFTAIFNSKGKLRYQLQRSYPDHELYFLNSGKSALCLAYSNIKLVTGKDLVAMPAYTCPDVASSAVRAGMRLLLLDFEQPNKLQVACPRVDEFNAIACTVGTNLYGLDDSSSLSDRSHRQGVFHIEDVCQAALSNVGDRALGVSGKSIGLISYGRGKAYCGVGGGLLLVPRNERHEPLLGELSHHYRDLPKPHFVESIVYIIKLFIFWILERPYFYWLVRFIPFTGLGETKVLLNFPIRRASRMELALMLIASRSRKSIRKQKLKVLAFYKGEQKKDMEEGDEAPVRLPVILNEEMKRALMTSYSSDLNKYGISPSYPRCIDEYKELQDFVLNQDTANAHLIAKSIITLPVHKYVRKRDVKKIFKTD